MATSDNCRDIVVVLSKPVSLRAVRLVPLVVLSASLGDILPQSVFPYEVTLRALRLISLLEPTAEGLKSFFPWSVCIGSGDFNCLSIVLSASDYCPCLVDMNTVWVHYIASAVTLQVLFWLLGALKQTCSACDSLFCFAKNALWCLILRPLLLKLDSH